MANFKESMKLLTFLEYSNQDWKLLHQNKNEDGLTFYGIYEKYNKDWKGWDIVKEQLKITPDIKTASRVLAKNKELENLAFERIKTKYWDRAKLDFVHSQKIADEIFLFGFNVGMPIAIKKSQKLVGISQDGLVGNVTLKALNSFDVNIFDIEFDKEEIKYYEVIIKDKPYLAPNETGWYARALFAFNTQSTDTLIA